MILFVGQVGGEVVEREAFQEIDYRRMYGQMTKWVAQIDRAERIPEYVSRAFHLAVSGRPGPVVLALPEDMLTSSSGDPRDPSLSAGQAQPGRAGDGSPRTDSAGRLKTIGDPGRRRLDRAGVRRCTRLRRAWNLPIACSFRRQDLLDNRHRNYVGEIGIAISPELKKRVREADVILALGPRLGEMTTGGYTLFDLPRPRQTLVHVHPAAGRAGARLPGRADDQLRAWRSSRHRRKSWIQRRISRGAAGRSCCARSIC